MDHTVLPANYTMSSVCEEDRVATLLHTYAVSTASHRPIPKRHYLPHPWTHPTYDAKLHPDLIRHFPIMHWTDQRTDRSPTGKFDHDRLLCSDSGAV